jgi:hypothetical protein
MTERPGTRVTRIELSVRWAFSILAVIVGLWLLSQPWQIVLLLLSLPSWRGR